MERQKDRQAEKVKEDKEVLVLRKELDRLRELKKQKEDAIKQVASQPPSQGQEITELEKPKPKELKTLGQMEEKLQKIDDYLVKQLGGIPQENPQVTPENIEAQLQELEEEIVGEKGILEKQIAPYELLLKQYPWLEQKRFEFMYTVPNKKINPADYKSWKTEWAKVLYDYAKFAVLHILYIRQIHGEKPFSNFQDRENAIREIAEELIDQDLARWVSKKKEGIRIYWKTLEIWAEEIYSWAADSGKIEPILLFEIKEAQKEFSTLPDDDLEEIFKILSKDRRGSLIKLDNGQIALKILVK